MLTLFDVPSTLHLSASKEFSTSGLSLTDKDWYFEQTELFCSVSDKRANFA